MSCTYYQYKDGLFSGDYWCCKKDCRVDDATYDKYCKDYNYDECPIYKHSESSSGCFITTIACQILGKKDDDVVLNDFRNFRDNILQKNPEYYDILKEYDVIGPMIAEAILHDSDREVLASHLYQCALLPIHHHIEEKEYSKAVEKYYLMTLMLINYYGLKHEYNQIKDQDYGYQEFTPSLSGHGKKRVKEM